MKRFFYSVLAAATMLFATTSCSQDEEIVSGGTTQSGTTQKVKFSVQLPDQTESRAIADGVEVGQGNMANSLRWALYEVDNNGNIVGNGPLETRMIEQETTDKEFNVSIDMVKGLKYKVLFLAYNKDNCIFNLADEDNDGDGDGDDLMSLDYKTTLVSNEEGYDAFVKCHDHQVNAEAVTTVELTRPFAQINAATTDTDLEKAAKLKATVVQSELVIKNVPTCYNILTGEVTNNKDIVTYSKAEILKQVDEQGNPTDNNEILKDVDTKNYNYLNMVYVLAGNETSTTSNHDATFNFYRAGDDTPVRVIDIPNLPIERNWRTNIVGDLLTQTEAFKIVIDENFKGDHNILEGEVAPVSTVQELQDAINNADGPTIIKFTQDINKNSTTIESKAAVEALIIIKQKEGVDLVIDGCGFKFDGKITVNGDGRSKGKETLTFKNINFYTESTEEFTFIDAPSKITDNGVEKYNYSHNVSIEDCRFEYAGTARVEIGSASFTGTYNLEMKNCTATNMHSILQVQSCDNTAVVDNIKTINCKNGVSFGNTAYPTISNSEINSTVYGIRGDGNASRGNLVIKNTTINAVQPLIIRKVTTPGYNVALEGENTLTTSGKYQVVFTSGSDDVAYVEPTVNYSISGAEGMTMFPVRVLHEESGLIWNGVNDRLFYLSSAEHLQKAVAYFYNGSGRMGEGRDITFELEADVDLNNTEWTPWDVMWINFNGNNHTISNVKVSEAWKGGFFGYAGAVKVNDLTLKNVNVTGAQVGILAGAAEGVTTENIKIEGTNSVTYKEYVSETYTETWGGIGAVTGVLTTSTINAEIVEGATVALNCGAITTEAPFVNYLTGYIQENNGTIANNGNLSVKTASKIVAEKEGVKYTGDVVDLTLNNAFVLENAVLSENATIELKSTYDSVILDGVKAELKGDAIIIEKSNTIILCDSEFTLEEGKMLVKNISGDTTIQVMIENVKVNGVILTDSNVKDYLHNIANVSIQ